MTLCYFLHVLNTGFLLLIQDFYHISMFLCKMKKGEIYSYEISYVITPTRLQSKTQKTTRAKPKLKWNLGQS